MFRTFVKHFWLVETAFRQIAEVVPEAAELKDGFAVFEDKNFRAEAGNIHINSRPGFRSAVMGPRCIFEIYREGGGFTARIDAGDTAASIARREGWKELAADIEQ